MDNPIIGKHRTSKEVKRVLLGRVADVTVSHKQVRYIHEDKGEETSSVMEEKEEEEEEEEEAGNVEHMGEDNQEERKEVPDRCLTSCSQIPKKFHKAGGMRKRRKESDLEEGDVSGETEQATSILKINLHFIQMTLDGLNYVRRVVLGLRETVAYGRNPFG
ncbi:hypothetical protein RUM44_005893 [Polyplax serrata]|uniref:Uncharacterized protein n=1 Tax=Polyplax serrata TaxID=468196 RepID=A0ABR1AZW7_POLSC